MRDLEFFIVEALIGIKRSSVMSLISIATITVCLIVFGLFLLITLNFNNVANFVAEKLEVRVFLKQNLSASDIEAFQKQVRAIDEVKRVQFIGKTQAWERFRTQFKNIDLRDFSDSNPLPNSFRVYLADNSKIRKTAEYLKSFQYHVDDVAYGGPIAERIERFSRYAKLSGIVLVSLLSMATLLIIMNTIRLTVIARQEEIAIMELVGATHSFIRWPFIIEGLFIGIIGAGVSVVFLNTTYLFFGNKFQSSFPFFPMVYDIRVLAAVYLTVLFGGMILGVLGAYIAVSRTLKARQVG